MTTAGTQALIETAVTPRKQFASATALKVEVLSTEAAFDALQPEWESLFAQSAQRVFFLGYSWNRLWWQSYAPARSHLFLLACRAADGELLGLAPLYWQQRTLAGMPHIRDLNFLGTGVAIKTSEELDVLARRGYERSVATALAVYLAERTDWDRLWLWNIPSHSTMLPQLQQALGEQAQIRLCDHPHTLATDVAWETVRQNWPRKFENNLERCGRNLNRDYTVSLRLAENPAAVESVWGDLIRLHQLRWQSKGEPGSFTYPGFEEFLHTAVRQAYAERRLRFWSLTLNGACAGALLAFVENGVAHYFQGGFDPAYAKYSIGNLMVRQCLQACIADPEIRAFDFMGGGAKYKDTWTKNVRDAYEIELFRPGWRTSLYQSGLQTRQTLGRWRRALRTRFQVSVQ